MQEVNIAGYGLSPQQKHIWAEPRNGADYQTQAVVKVDGPVNDQALKAALASIVSRYEVLRTTFRRQTGMKLPVQVINEDLEPAWAAIGVCDLPPNQREVRIQAVLRENAEQPFDLENGPLIRATLAHLSNDRHCLLITAHALVADAESLRTIMQEWSSIYAGAGSCYAAVDPLQYADYAEWQKDRKSTRLNSSHIQKSRMPSSA